MMRSLWTAASGMNGQQFNIDTISNNLSNVNTTGFKQSRAEFEDLIYMTSRTAGTPATERTVVPEGTQVGHGVKVAASKKLFEQGSLQNTGVSSDMAISGEGFFRVLLPNGTWGYTRDGSFDIDSNGQFVTSNGYRLQPDLVMPDGFMEDSLSISQQGEVNVRVNGEDDPRVVGQVNIFRFANPAGLKSIGDNVFKMTQGSGDPLGGRPGNDGMGQIQHKFLENSNVSIVKEMVNMIVAQRAYEINSKAIQTSDSMLGIANNLKR